MKKLLILPLFFLSVALLVACGNTQEELETIVNELDFATETSENLDLPSASGDVNLTYSSDNTDVLANDGTIEQQASDTDVLLTVTGSLEDETYSRDVTVTVLALTDQEMLDLALESITLSSEVMEDITWPTLSDDRLSNVTLTFASDDPSVIGMDGSITRQLTNETATITATATLGDESDSKTFDVTVLARDLTDQDIVTQVADDFTFPFTSIENDIALPASDDNVNITWSSSETDNLSNDGVVTRPFIDDLSVTLTATFTLNDTSTTRDYTVTVVGLDEEDIAATLSNVEYTIEQVTLSDELNAEMTISGNAVIDPDSTTRTISLVLYYQDDTVIESMTNEIDNDTGAFEFTFNINDYSIGWDWYKFALSIDEDTLQKDFVLLPYTADEEGVIAVLKGQDGDVREFRMIANEGFLNVSTHGIDDNLKTDFAKVVADYERLSIADELLSGYVLPVTTGQWGQGSTITWATSDALVAEVNQDNELVVNETGTVTLDATIANGQEAIVKSFVINAVRGSVAFENQTAAFETETDVDDNVLVNLIVSGDITVDDLTERTYTLEAFITPGTGEQILGTYSNISTSETSYEFSVPVSALTFNGEWIKFRLIIGENNETITYTFPNSSITVPSTYQAGINNDTIQYYYAGNEYDMFYVRTDLNFQTDNTSVTNTRLVVDNDRVILEIEGNAYAVSGYDSVITLTIGGSTETYNNTLDGTTNAYLFEIDITDFEANGNWLDIHLNMSQTVGSTTYTYFNDFYAPWDVKDALNAAYEVEVGGKSFGFAEWASALKVVVATP